MIQTQLINYLIQTNDTSIITMNNLTKDYFAGSEAEFTYILNFYKQWGKIPDKETFISTFPDFDYVETKETPQYLLSKLFEEYKIRLIAQNYNEIRNLVMGPGADAEKLQKCTTMQQTLFEKLSSAGSSLQCTDLFKDTSRYERYEDKIDNFDKYFITTGFPELDEIVCGWDINEDLVTIAARNGLGKCLEKGTKILMADGTTKKVEDVVVGDKVQSLNSVNTVLALHNGKSKGYRIIPKIGDPFVVSANHILTLMKAQTSGEFALEDITIEDYLELNKSNKSKYRLYRPSVNYSEKSLSIPPYVFGTQVRDKEELPLDYLTSSENQRLELLAGLVDTDGYFSGSAYEISTKYYNFAQNIAQLARGLGFKVSKIKTRKIKTFTHYRVNISGDLYRVPVRLSRKRVAQKIKNKPFNALTTTFRVEEVPEIEYFGFMADGDHRYMLADNTLTHNTWILLKCATAAALAGKKVGLYSGEMSEDTVGYRIDTLHSHLSNGAMMHGGASIKDSYKKYLEDLKNAPGSFKVITPKSAGGLVGVSTLRTFIEKENLDILFVDQHSLLEDDRGASNPVEKAANISKDLKTLQATKRIPIICVSQQNREKLEDGKGNKSFDTTQISQSDRIAQDSSMVIFIERKDDLVKLHLTKVRNAPAGKVLSYITNLNEGTFVYVPEEEEQADITKESEQTSGGYQLPTYGVSDYGPGGGDVFDNV